MYQEATGNPPLRNGKFIVHLLQPSALFKIHTNAHGTIHLEHIPVKGWDESSVEVIEPIMRRAKDWYVQTILK